MVIKHFDSKRNVSLQLGDTDRDDGGDSGGDGGQQEDLTPEAWGALALQVAIEADINAQGLEGAVSNVPTVTEEHPGPAQTSNARIESSDSGRGHSSMDTLVGIQVKCEQKI